MPRSISATFLFFDREIDTLNPLGSAVTPVTLVCVRITSSQDYDLPILQAMQVGNQIINRFRRERFAKRWHHPSAIQDGLLHEPIVGGQSARQKFPFEQSFHRRPIQASGRICIVAGSTI